MKNNVKRASKDTIVATIVVIIMLVMLGAIGYLVWQHFSENRANTGVQSSAVSEKTVPIARPFGLTINVTYPETWKYDVETKGPAPASRELVQEGQITQERITITSPSGNVQVVYSISNAGGLGGACFPEEENIITRAAYQELPRFANVGLGEFAVTDEAIQQPTLYVTDQPNYDDTPLTQIEAGASVCELVFRPFIALGEDPENFDAILRGYVTLPQFTDEAGSLSGEAERINALLMSEEALIAKKILLSTAKTE